MSRNRFAKASAIGTVSLGLLAAALGAGCGSSGPSGSGSASNSTPEKAAITQEGQWAVGGCGATGTFTITSPQEINFIAINASAFKNAQFQLQVVTSDNKTIQVNNQIQHADSLLQQIISNAATTFNLNKTNFDQSAMQDSMQSTDVTNDVMEYAKANQNNSGFAQTITNTTNLAFQKSSANQWSSASQSATNKANARNDSDTNSQSMSGNTALATQEANASNSAKATNTASNSATQNANGQNFAQNLNMSLVPVAAGAVAAFPLFNNNLSNSFFTNGASLSNEAANASSANQRTRNNAVTSANNTAFANNNVDTNNKSHVDSATTANAMQASHVDNQNLTFNKTHLDTTTMFNNMAEADSTRTLDQEATTSAMTSADTSANGDTFALNKASNTSLATATNITNTNANAFVFANLQQFNSNTFRLVTNLTQSQVNAVIQLFQGNQDDVVSNAAAFPVVTPTCM
jgi:epidermal growth factor receptor substrate 15